MTRSEVIAEFAAALELGQREHALQIASSYLATTGNSNALPFFEREIENHPRFRSQDLASVLLDEMEVRS